MDFIAVAVLLALIGLCYVLVKHNNKKVAEERDAAEDTAAAARAQERLSTLVPWIEEARSPADVLALCDHRPPLSLRFQNAEQVLWVVPNCEYMRTTKQVTYEGRSSGVSVRVAKGVSVRAGGSRGRRVENEYLETVDCGTVVLTNKHIYFQGEDKERFRVRLDKLVSVEPWADALQFQRDGARARPEVFVSYDVRILWVLLHWLEAPEPGPGAADEGEDRPHDMLDAAAAWEADSGDQ